MHKHTQQTFGYHENFTARFCSYSSCILEILKFNYDEALFKYSKSPYSSSEMNIIVDGKEIKSKKEYYDEFKTLRSVSIWKNGKKDSVWKTFSEDGKIIKQQTFHNDTLVEK